MYVRGLKVMCFIYTVYMYCILLCLIQFYLLIVSKMNVPFPTHCLTRLWYAHVLGFVFVILYIYFRGI